MPALKTAASVRYKKALEFAKKAHKGQKRTSGEPYFHHVVAVADFLKTIHADEDTLVAALLHDTVEDTNLTFKDIKREFGPVVAKLVEGVTKVEKLEMTDKRERNMQSIRKVFHAMGKDIRVIFIKLADRLHNMQTLECVPIEKQLRIAHETQDIYVPLADLVGIRPWFQNLSDACFQILQPTNYDIIRKKFEKAQSKQHVQIDQWKRALTSLLHTSGFPKARVELVRAHFQSVYAESKNQEDLLNDIETFYHLHITLPNTDDCYKCLGAIHEYSPPIPHYIDDYIASPKVNEYRALHTTVMSLRGNPITIIVQTETMAEEATLGLARLYTQKKDVKKTFKMPDWVETLTSLEQDERDLYAFFTMIQSEIFGERCRVYIEGQKKKFTDLPLHATLLDLAYYTSAMSGARIESGLINNKPSNVKSTVQEGDTVKMVLGKTHRRTAQDFYSLHTSFAQKQLTSELSHLPKKERQKRGGTLLSHAINITMDPFFGITWQKMVRDRVDGSPDILANIGTGMVDPFLFLEENCSPEDFFLLDGACFHHYSRAVSSVSMRYVLRAEIEKLRKGKIIGVQVGPDVIDVIEQEMLEKSVYTKEVIPLRVNKDMMLFPFHFALRINFLQDANPLEGIATLQSLLDTPVKLLQFANTSVTLGFHTDRLRTVQIAYEYLFGLPYVTDIFRITPT
jgi:guanosine-3',5'-bis(diphosphate) 3'-pyrophosphohydrolase